MKKETPDYEAELLIKIRAEMERNLAKQVHIGVVVNNKKTGALSINYRVSLNSEDAMEDIAELMEHFEIHKFAVIVANCVLIYGPYTHQDLYQFLNHGQDK